MRTAERSFLRPFALAATLLFLLRVLLLGETPPHEPGWRLLAPDDSGGLIFHRMLLRWGKATLRSDTVTPTADCCSSNAQWMMSSEPVDAAVMCPNAARTLVEKDARYAVVGPCLINADVRVVRPENASPKVAVMQNRGYQADALQGAGVPLSDLAPMIPSGIPYALEKGFVGSGVVDVLTALRLAGGRESLSSADVTTYVLVVRRSFREGPEWAEFARLYDECVEELTSDPTEAIRGFRNLELKREDFALWKKLRVAFLKLPPWEAARTL